MQFGLTPYWSRFAVDAYTGKCQEGCQRWSMRCLLAAISDGLQLFIWTKSNNVFASIHYRREFPRDGSRLVGPLPTSCHEVDTTVFILEIMNYPWVPRLMSPIIYGGGNGSLSGFHGGI